MRYHLKPIGMAMIKRTKDDKDVLKRESCTCCWKYWYSLYGKQNEGSKFKTVLHNPATFLQGMHIKGMKSLRQGVISTLMFIAALPTIVMVWKQPKLSVHVWIKKVWSIHMCVCAANCNWVILSLCELLGLHLHKPRCLQCV